MGTGRSRIGLSTQESYNTILGICLSNTILIQGHIHIVINPEILENIDIHGGNNSV